MKIYNSRAFKIANEIAREAVAEGSQAGYGFDWDCAMVFLKVAYGYDSIDDMECIGAQYEG